MADISQPYDLTEQAAQDLENIFDYTASEFGVGQAITYVSKFEGAFENLATNSTLGRERNEIRKDIRSFVKNSHIIFYRIVRKRVRVIRILHASRDIRIFL